METRELDDSSLQAMPKEATNGKSTRILWESGPGFITKTKGLFCN